jgi:predicted metal-binding membrane protein
MAQAALETLLRRDRVIVVAALATLAALAWGYLLWLAADMDMGGMDMTGFRMVPSGRGLMLPDDTPWSAGEFAFVFAMWVVMMVGMMAPSAAPMILIYAKVSRQATAERTPFGAAGWFAGGYFLAWTVFSLLATAAEWALDRAALVDARMTGTNDVLGGVVLIAAGAYQWTRLKDTCLTQCQTPFSFLMRHDGVRRNAAGCLKLGLRHGAYCVGCCWVLMALLFVGGVMNVLWIAVLAALVLLEMLRSGAGSRASRASRLLWREFGFCCCR